MFIYSTPELIRHLWQLKTIVFLQQYLICSFLLVNYDGKTKKSFRQTLQLIFTGASGTFCQNLFFVRLSIKPGFRIILYQLVSQVYFTLRLTSSQEIFWYPALKLSEAKFASLHLDQIFWQLQIFFGMVKRGLTYKAGYVNLKRSW